MRLTEHEMTLAIQGVAKHALAQYAAASGATAGDFDADAALKQMEPYERFTLLSGFGDAVLPVLVALPDIDVAPGTRPQWTLGVVAQVVDDVTRAECERAGQSAGETLPRARFDEAVAARLAAVSVALGSLPVRVDPDALLDADSVINAIVVPDTIEGI